MEMKATHLQRVVITGTSCSGKTTLARSLAQKLKLRRIELDALFWKPNWTPTPSEEFRSVVAEAIEPEAWVVDGNYSAVRDILWERATTLIWLNYPFHVVARRALRRTCGRVFRRQVMWSGNTETFRRSFLSKDSILLWVLKTYRRRRRDYPRLFQEPRCRHLRILVFTSPAETERFLESLG